MVTEITKPGNHGNHCHKQLTYLGTNGNHQLSHGVAVIHVKRLDRVVQGTYAQYAQLLLVLEQVLYATQTRTNAY